MKSPISVDPDFCFQRLTRLGVATFGGVAAVSILCDTALAQRDPIALRINHAVEVEYQSAPGQVYEVQSSADNRNWKSVGEQYFGDGAQVVDLISYRQTGERARFFRVRVKDAREVGIGPVSLTGATYLLNDGGVLRTMRFENAATGTVTLGGESPETFRYGFLKTGPSGGRLQLIFDKENSETISFDFATDSAGSFQCERFRDGEPAERDAGTFSRVYMGDDVVLRRDEGVPAPASPIGYALVLFAGEQSNVIRVMNDIIVKESMRNSSTSYRYDYATSGNTGQLTIWKAHDKYDFYELGFTSVGSGDFKRSQYSDGTLLDADVGVFSVFGAPASVQGPPTVQDGGGFSPLDANDGLVHFPESPEPVQDGDVPPRGEDFQCKMPGELEGICVEVTANGKTEKLCFYTDGSGSLVRETVSTSIFVPFDYEYEAQDVHKGRVVIEFATADGLERVVYEFSLDDGCNGTYSRTSHVEDRVTGQDTGQFSMSAELIVPDPRAPGGAAVVANPNQIGVAAQAIRRTVLGN